MSLLLLIKVRFNDQLKIESVKTQGQFLHSSNRTLGSSNASFNVLQEWSVIQLFIYLFVYLFICLFVDAVLS